MKVPNAENSIVDIRKLRDYCLNPAHDEGKYKARVFERALGMTSNDAEELRDLLMEAVRTNEARLGRHDEYGQRYTVDFLVNWRDKRAIIRSGWIIEHESDMPKLTSCYPLLK